MSQSPSDDLKIAGIPVKCVVVGDAEVGKTCLMIAFARQESIFEYTPSCVDSYTVGMTIDSQRVLLFIQDTAGSESYDDIRPHFYAGSNVVIMVFSLMSEGTLDRILSKWNPEVQKYRMNVPILLVGTFNDLAGEHAAITEKAKKVAEQIGAVQYLEVCSTSLSQTTEVFTIAARVGGALSEKKEGPQSMVSLSLPRPVAENDEPTKVKPDTEKEKDGEAAKEGEKQEGEAGAQEKGKLLSKEVSSPKLLVKKIEKSDDLTPDEMKTKAVSGSNLRDSEDSDKGAVEKKSYSVEKMEREGKSDEPQPKRKESDPKPVENAEEEEEFKKLAQGTRSPSQPELLRTESTPDISNKIRLDDRHEKTRSGVSPMYMDLLAAQPRMPKLYQYDVSPKSESSPVRTPPSGAPDSKSQDLTPMAVEEVIRSPKLSSANADHVKQESTPSAAEAGLKITHSQPEPPPYTAPSARVLLEKCMTDVNVAVSQNPLFNVWIYRGVGLTLTAEPWGESTEHYLLKIKTRAGKCRMYFVDDNNKTAYKFSVGTGSLLAVRDSSRFFVLNLQTPVGLGFKSRDESGRFIVEYMKKMYEARNYKGKRRVFIRRKSDFAGAPITEEVATSDLEEGADGHKDGRNTPHLRQGELDVYDNLEAPFVAALQNNSGESQHADKHERKMARAVNSAISEAKPSLRAAPSQSNLLTEKAEQTEQTEQTEQGEQAKTKKHKHDKKHDKPELEEPVFDPEEPTPSKLKKLDEHFNTAATKRASKAVRGVRAREDLLRTSVLRYDEFYQQQAISETHRVLERLKDQNSHLTIFSPCFAMAYHEDSSSSDEDDEEEVVTPVLSSVNKQ